MNSIYHSGEVAVQKLAGVEQMAAQNGKTIRSSLPKVGFEILKRQEVLIVGSRDTKHKVWASILLGKPGFIEAQNEHRLIVKAEPSPHDPLFNNLQENNEIGLLAIEFATRRRLRINGKSTVDNNSIYIQVEQVYANCPKYIQARNHPKEIRLNIPKNVSVHSFLTEKQKSWIRNANTFFIATSDIKGKMDASHRGGNPGFIQVKNETTLLFPDYFGNAMFNTLGNIYNNPNTGLLFIDFKEGHTLQLTGTSSIIWDEEEISKSPGAERVVMFKMESGIEITNENTTSWEFIDYSPFNPK